MKSKALLITGIDQIEQTEVDIPSPGSRQVVVKTHYSCISPGTELRCLSGQQPGSPDFPFIPGYAAAGEIVETGSASRWKKGTKVRASGTTAASTSLCWGGHAEFLLVGDEAVQAIPPGVDLVEASLTRLAAISYRGLQVARPLPHHRVVVIGLGPIGQLSARLFHAAGSHVVGVDLDPGRAGLLSAAGITGRAIKGSLEETLKEDFAEGADIVVDATGSAAVPGLAARLLRQLPWTDQPGPPPRYILQGSATEPVRIPYHDFFRSETQILLPRDSRREDLEACLDLLARQRIRIHDLVTKIVSPDQAEQVYAELREKGTKLMTAAFQWA